MRRRSYAIGVWANSVALVQTMDAFSFASSVLVACGHIIESGVEFTMVELMLPNFLAALGSFDFS